MEFELSERPSSWGHQFIIGLEAPELTDRDKRVLAELQPSGVLLLARNFEQSLPYAGWHDRLTKLIRSIHEYAERETMFITLDHEGGRVHRTPPPITRFPSPRRYVDAVREVATAMAVELRSLGVNVSWLPLADINWNSANPVIGERAFGETVADVVTPAVECARTLLEEGILSCAKHFPGHGGTSADSHHELPVLNLTAAELEARDLEPFRALCEVAVPFVMTAHILFPQIDPDLPATLSRKILHHYLRDLWGYDGIVISDDLDMDAVSQRFTKDDAAALAIQAGCDMFIVAQRPARAFELCKDMLRSVQDGKLSEERLHRSFRRVKNLLRNTKRHTPHILDEAIRSKHAELSRRLEGSR